MTRVQLALLHANLFSNGGVLTKASILRYLCTLDSGINVALVVPDAIAPEEVPAYALASGTERPRHTDIAESA